jgi:hypothetical protein
MESFPFSEDKTVKIKGGQNRWPVSMALSIKEKGGEIITKQTNAVHVMK